MRLQEQKVEPPHAASLAGVQAAVTVLDFSIMKASLPVCNLFRSIILVVASETRLFCMPSLNISFFFSHKIQQFLFTTVTHFKITDMPAGKVIIRSLLWKEDKISSSRDLLLENE